MARIHPPKWWCLWKALNGTRSHKLAVTEHADLRGHWVVLTGGNNGIGLEAAIQFAAWGANVVLACRTDLPPTEVSHDKAVERCLAAARTAGHDKNEVEWWPCDMASLDSVNKFAQRWLATGRPLDILCNNAGISPDPRSFTKTGDGFEITHQVNFLSHVAITFTLLPALEKAASPRIICTTSCMQYLGIFDLDNANSGKNSYANNKLYFQTWLTELQGRLLNSHRYSHIVAHGVHPGYVKTGIWRTDVRTMDLGDRVLHALLPWIGISAQQGSLTIINAATTREGGLQPLDRLEGMSFMRGGARYFNRTWEETPMPQTRDRESRCKVWAYVNKELLQAGCKVPEHLDL